MLHLYRLYFELQVEQASRWETPGIVIGVSMRYIKQTPSDSLTDTSFDFPKGLLVASALEGEATP